jgi:hypothetical protein
MERGVAMRNDDGRLWTLGALGLLALASFRSRGSPQKLAGLPDAFYHGTPYESAARGIQQRGIVPPDLAQRTGPLRPVEGRVYLSPTPELATVHALGGVLMEHQMPEFLLRGEGEYGYVFVVPTERLGVIHPDEDDIGRMVGEGKPVWLRKIAEELLAGRMPETPEPVCLIRNLRWSDLSESTQREFWEERGNPRMRPYLVPGSEDWEKLEEWLQDHPDHDHEEWWEYAPQDLLELIDEGEYVAYAEGGKILLPHLTPAMQKALLRRGANVAHQGPVQPSECWKLRKRDSIKLLPDASNVFEVATRCP